MTTQRVPLLTKFKNLFLNEFFILGLIVVNAIVIFIDEFDVSLDILDILEVFITTLFIAEILVKMNHFGIRGYFKSNWNKMDFFLILISLPSLAILFYGQSVIDTNIFLTLRVLRVFKSFRMIRFMPQAGSFVKSIQRALRASYVILLGFLVLVFITALISCSLYKEVAPEYFRNPLVSIYSTFQLFSIEGWYEIPDLIAERSSETAAFFTKLYFSVLLMGGGILGLSLVNSIFVDAMVSDNTDDLETDVKNLTQKIDSLERKIDQLLDSDE